MSLSLTIDFDRPQPLFPLPQCLLLPHATAPLHIFEPRYCAMVRDALAGDGLIAMATFENEGYKSADAAPPIRPYVCLGRIAQHQSLSDGRYYLLLQGVCRARIAEELEPADCGYRMARLDPTEPADQLEIDFAEQRQTIEKLLRDPILADLNGVASVRRWLNDEIPTTTMIDLASLALVRDPEGRYALLAEPDPTARGYWLEADLRRARKTLQLAAKLGPAIEDGYNLN